ncbi:unnamed protein product [Amoebophrya sp. A120]|nr:unnamed protein product [Amoebophrya sp. A120]|eukprot:GSA120T00021917001.1
MKRVSNITKNMDCMETLPAPLPRSTPSLQDRAAAVTQPGEALDFLHSGPGMIALVGLLGPAEVRRICGLAALWQPPADHPPRFTYNQ